MRLIFGREQGWISPVIGWIERELREICTLDTAVKPRYDSGVCQAVKPRYDSGVCQAVKPRYDSEGIRCNQGAG